MYNDEYPTCAKTYATLCIYPGEIDPAEVTLRLGIEPSRWQRRGEAPQRANRSSRVATLHGWFLESQDQVESRDSRRHVDWILDHLESKGDAIRSLQQAGCRMMLWCYWLSRSGHGGPMVWPSQMKRLGVLEIELAFDFYGPFEREDDAPDPR